VAKIVVVGPHPDDAEIGMGGTVALLASQGHDVLLLDITDGCPTPVGDRPTRLAEAKAAAEVLGVQRALLDLPNRKVMHSLEARHAVAGVIRSWGADVLFMPHPEDAHPDHLATTRIVEDARFDAKLTKVEMPHLAGLPPVGPPRYPKWVFYYYCSHLRNVPAPTFMLDTAAFAAAKKRSIECYRSQFALNPLNAGFPERMATQDAYFGSRIGAAAAEPFWCKEPLGLKGLGELA